MKLERLFQVKGGKLFKISGEDFPLSSKNIKSVKWSEAETSPEEYNEEFLANLRNELKSLEEKGEFVLIEPVFDKADVSEESKIEQFTAAMKHTARRIKDCGSVIGFAIPQEIESKRDFYISELIQKHQQYCFFSKTLQEDSIARY